MQSQTPPAWNPNLTSGGANSMLFKFTKQVWLNPTIIIAKQNFEQAVNVKLLIVPRLNSNDTTGSSRIEKAFDKLLSFLVYQDNIQGSIKFFFDPHNPAKPFTFSTSDELHCKFTQLEKDTIVQLLNLNIANSSNLNNFTALPFEANITQASLYCKKILQSKPGSCGPNPDNEFTLTQINTTPAKLNFERTPYQQNSINGGVDKQKYAELAQHYNTVIDKADNSNYQMVWKAMDANSNDFIKLKLKKKQSSFDISKLVFKNAAGTETYNTTFQSSDSTISLSMGGKAPGSMAEVVAYYTPAATPPQTFAIGAFNVQFYQAKPLNVVLISLDNAPIPNSNAVKDTLNKIYGNVFINWNVSTASCNLPPDISKSIHIGSSGLLSNYMPDMQPIVSHFKDNCPEYNGSEENTYYLLFGCTNDGSQQGYMPRARNTGFIFDLSPHTIAHELGHGAFNLKHIFSSDELGEGNRYLTNNIMDYASGNASVAEISQQSALYKHQWDLIHDPSFVGWFEGDDDEGALNSTCAFDAGGKYFIAPNGKVFIMPAGAKIAVTMSGYGDGAVYGFIKDSKYYIADVPNSGPQDYFNGYKNNGNAFPSLAYLQTANDVNVVFKENNLTKIYKLNSYQTIPDPDVKENNMKGVANNAHIDWNQQAFASKTAVFTCSGSSNNNNAYAGDIVNYSHDENNNSKLSEQEVQQLKTLCNQLNTKFHVSSKVYILNNKNPNYTAQLAGADSDSKPNKIIITINNNNVELLYKIKIDIDFGDYSNTCTDQYINEGLIALRNTSLYKIDWLFGKIISEYRTVMYRGFFGYWYCATDEQSVAGKSSSVKYLAGAAHELIATVDVVIMVEGLYNLGKGIVSNQINAYDGFISDLHKTYTDIKQNQQISPTELLKRLLPPNLRADLTVAPKIINAVKNFTGFYFTDCDNPAQNPTNMCPYRYGQITVMIVPIVFTAGEWAIARSGAMITRLKEISSLASTSSKVEEVAVLLEKAEDLGYTVLKEPNKMTFKDGDNVISTVDKNGSDVSITKSVSNAGSIVNSVEELASFVSQNGIRSDINLQFVITMTQGRRDLIENILLSTKEVVEGKNLQQLVQHFNIPNTPSVNSLTNYQARIWYKSTKANIGNIIDNTKSLEIQSKQAFDLRNSYRSQTRQFMSDRNLAQYLQQNELNEVWGNFIQTTATKTGKSGDALWNEIIDKSMHGRERVDELFKLDGL